LFHQTFEGKKKNTLVDFGGAVEEGEDLIYSAAREWAEETLALFETLVYLFSNSHSLLSWQLIGCESLCLLEIQAKVRTNFLRKVETRIAFLRAIRSLARILRRHKLSQPIKYTLPIRTKSKKRKKKHVARDFCPVFASFVRDMNRSHPGTAS
jgi:hypothetical protein